MKESPVYSIHQKRKTRSSHAAITKNTSARMSAMRDVLPTMQIRHPAAAARSAATGKANV